MNNFEFPLAPFPDPNPEDLVFLFSGRYLFILPELSPVTRKDLPPEYQSYPRFFCGRFDGRDVFCGEDPSGPGREGEDPSFIPQDSQAENWMDLRLYFSGVSADWAGVCGRASLLRLFHRNHHFCGRCATPTETSAAEVARVCPTCHHVFYPRLSPAVITLIYRGDEILLGHNAKAPQGSFSLFAGFVEAGESYEQAAIREVREESGVEVKNLQFHSSQSWPFPDALMVGFLAEYSHGQWRPDGEEITEIRWFSRENPPPAFRHGSIAKTLLDYFWNQKESS